MHPFNRQAIDKGCVGIAWFGQNSFAIKGSDGMVVLIDPYFPSVRPGERFLHGEAPGGVFSLAPDVILLTHDHSDHTDIETLRRYRRQNPSLHILGPKECVARLGEGRILSAGETIPVGELLIRATAAKEPKPGQIEHLSYILTTGDGCMVYCSGDVQNDFVRRESLMQPLIAEKPHIGLLTTHPTEGEFPFFEDTVELARRAGLRFAVPAHYGCFTARSYDPFSWQRRFPLYGARPVILPYNGFAQFRIAEQAVEYGYSDPIRTASCSKGLWCWQTVYTLTNGTLEAVLDPRWGGSIFRLTNLKKGCEILHTPVNHAVYSARNRIYGIPILLPPNRIKNGRFKTSRRTYEMEINSPDGHHCHGMASQLPWEVTDFGVDAEQNPFIATLFENRVGCAFYDSFPHSFRVRCTYTLQGDLLRHAVSCENLGEEPMPFGLGCHTAFNVPFHMASRAEHVSVRLAVDKRWELDKVSIPTCYQAPRMAIEDAYRNDGIPAQGQAIRDHYSAHPLKLDGEPFNGAILTDHANGLRLEYRAGASFRHWMIWNEDGCSGFICPEPMTWAIDAPNLPLPGELTGYRELAPREKWEDWMTIQVKEDKNA